MGVVFVAGAGNNNGQDIAGVDGVWGINPATGMCDDFIPAALPEVMAVSAMDPVNNVIASFSNCCRINKVPSYVTSPGLGIDVAAPGVNIYSCWLTSTNGYTFQSGTSGASPHVAGLVALYIAANGRATNAAGVYAIRQAIIDGSQPQSQWGATNTMDPDGNPEPLAMPSTNWVPQPDIISVVPSPGACQLSFATVPGYIYTVQSRDSLSDTNQWITLGNPYTNMLGSLLKATVTDTNPSFSARFYQLVRTQAP
jgi:subtilisin family serine protease